MEKSDENINSLEEINSKLGYSADLLEKLGTDKSLEIGKKIREDQDLVSSYLLSLILGHN